MTFTRGKRRAGYRQGNAHQHRNDEKMRIYDRLRKASYRKLGISIADERWEWWTEDDHRAYVRGVREALNG